MITKKLIMVLILISTVSIMKCEASNTMLNDIITSDNNNTISPYNKKEIINKSDANASLDTIDSSFDEETNSRKIDINKKISNIELKLDNINNNLNKLVNLKQNDITIQFNNEIEEIFKTFYNKTIEFNKKSQDAFIDPSISEHVKSNGNMFSNILSVVSFDSPLKAVANIALSKGLDFYKSQIEESYSKIFLNLKNTKSVSKYSDIQTEFYQLYDDFARSISSCFSIYNNNLKVTNSDDINSILQEIWKNSYESLLLFSTTFSSQLKSCIEQLNHKQLFTSIEAITKYINTKLLLEPIINKFTKQIAMIDKKNHDYKREISAAYMKLSDQIHKEIFHPQNKKKYSIDEIQYVWTILIMKYYTTIITTLKQLNQSFPYDKVLETFKKYYPICTIISIEYQYCESNNLNPKEYIIY